MARGAVTAITTVTGFLVIPLGRVGQGSEAREHPRCLVLGTFVRSTQGGYGPFFGNGGNSGNVTRGALRTGRGEPSDVCCVREPEKPDFVTEVMFMGWETRERGGWYYTRSKWVNGRVTREYVGTGALGKVVALDDELERLQKEEENAWSGVQGSCMRSRRLRRSSPGLTC